MTYEDKAFYDSPPSCSPLISELKFEHFYQSTSSVQLTLENFGDKYWWDTALAAQKQAEFINSQKSDPQEWSAAN